MVCAPEMLGKYYRSTNALMPLAADATRLLTARFPACVAGKRKGPIFRGNAIVFPLSVPHVSPLDWPNGRWVRHCRVCPQHDTQNHQNQRIGMILHEHVAATSPDNCRICRCWCEDDSH